MATALRHGIDARRIRAGRAPVSEGAAMNAEMRQARRALTFWDGKAPEFDASILMTAYNSENTIGEAIRSIFAQNIRDGVRVQLVIGHDPSPDATLDIARALAASSESG